MPNRITAACGACFVLCLLAACSTASERDAFQRWYEADAALERKPYAPSEDIVEESSHELPMDSSLPALINYALQHHPALAARSAAWEASLHRVPQVRALPDPRLTYSRDDMDREDSYGLGQAIPWPGKLKNRALAAERDAEIDELAYQRVRLEVVSRVKQAYAEWVFIARAVTLVEASLRMSQQVVDSVEARYRVGQAMQSDFVRAQAEVDQARSNLEKFQSARPAIAARLNAAMGRRSGEGLPPGESLDWPKLMQSGAELESALRSRNPMLVEMDRRVEAARARIHLARQEGFADLEIEGQYMREPGMEAYGLVVGIVLPIYREKYQAMRAEALARFDAEVHERHAMALELQERLHQLIYEVEDAARRIDLFDQRIGPKAKAAYESIQAAYRAGEADMTDLLTAHRELFDIQLSLERARADLYQRHAELELLLGGSVHEATP